MRADLGVVPRFRCQKHNKLLGLLVPRQGAFDIEHLVRGPPFLTEDRALLEPLALRWRV